MVSHNLFNDVSVAFLVQQSFLLRIIKGTRMQSIKYLKNSPDYLGAGSDMAHHFFDAFSIGDEVHIVYSLGMKEQFVATQKKEKLRSNPDDYLWTPFTAFIYSD